MASIRPAGAFGGITGDGAHALVSQLVRAPFAVPKIAIGDAGTAATDEIASDMLSSTELFAAERGGVLLLHPERLTGTLERGDLTTPYRANVANLVAAAEMTPRGPAIRIRAGDRVRARIADLALDVEGLVDGRA